MANEPAVPYPHRTPPGTWKPATLYGIAGWYTQYAPNPAPGYEAVAFGGHFRLNEDNTIDGQLIDVEGPAVIEGMMFGNGLNFDKHYLARLTSPQDKVTYEFQFQDGLWIGSYRLGRGSTPPQTQAACRVFKAVPDAYGLEVATKRDLWEAATNYD